MRSLAAAAVLLLLAGCSTATRGPGPPDLAGAEEGYGSHAIDVRSGEAQTLAAFGALNPDCSLEGYPSVHILTPPGNGRLVAARGEAHSSFPAGDIRANCNRLSTPAMILTYEPKPGYVGPDAAMVEVLFPMGAVRTLQYQITVR
jgi:hypothetical protein